MRYVSTRGAAREMGFTDVLLHGLADDGGLYVPAEWPALPPPAAGATYAQRAAQIVQLFVGDELAPGLVERLCEQAYATFDHSEVVPDVRLGESDYLLELFHGPTLAFKDLALQLVGRMFEEVLRTRGERVTVVGATSGDTGSAAIEAVKHCANVDIVILFPKGRTSELQRKQMTTVDAPNVRVVAVEGTFDDCQDLVKAMFGDAEFRKRMRLSAVNSINWARVMAQVVYYVVTTDRLGAVNVSVPSGNFGNAFSGWIARRMGAPISQLVVASNANDILERFFNRNDMTTAPVVPSLSPSMDIQVSSNFERLLFEINRRDGGLTAEQLQRFRTTGMLSIESDQRRDFIEGRFQAARLDDDETLAVMARTYASSGVLLDPHSAVGVGSAAKLRAAGTLHGTTVTLATAHPAKFPDAVARATGVRPPLPPQLAKLVDLPEHFDVLPNDLAVIQHFVATAF